MAFRPDVVTHTTTLSTWGNGIRDRTVHLFDSVAERDAHTNLGDGALGEVAGTRITFVLLTGVWWPMAMPWTAYTARVWSNDGSGSWQTSTLGSVKRCECTRAIDRVHVGVDVDFSTFGGVGTTRAVAVALPWLPYGSVNGPLGSGWLFDAGAGRYRGGGAYYGGGVAGFEVASVLDMQTGAQARLGTNGTVSLELTYHTVNASHIPAVAAAESEAP